ncbi:MAG: leucine-rich repeat domain-containing protein, partial [bacterium]|nr:leucine-rich repeat domain-containing protein [bacterium]
MKRYFLLLQMLCTSFALQAATWTDPETNLTWSYEPIPQGVMITNISSYPEILEIPATINNLPVKEIGYQTFYNCSFMTSVTIPEGVVEIGEAAFEHCVSLTSITFPKSLKRIDKHAFNNCKSLESIDIPKGLEYLGEGAFSACPSFVYDDSGATFEG